MYMKVGMERRRRTIKRILPFCKGKKVLDIGSGAGVTTNYLSKNGFDIVGIDIDSAQLNLAKKIFPKNTFLKKDLIKEKGKYDTILLVGVLEECFYSPRKVLTKLEKNLKHGGRIILAVRNANSLRRRVKTIFGLDPVDPFSWRHWVFTKKRLTYLITDCGYEIINIFSNNRESFRYITIPTPDYLSEEIWAVIQPKKDKD